MGGIGGTRPGPGDRQATCAAAKPVLGALQRLGVPPSVIAAETATLTPVRVARTSDRSVLGTLVNFTRELPCHLPINGWDETTLPFVEFRLGETPSRDPRTGKDTLWPARDAKRLLMERWGALDALA